MSAHSQVELPAPHSSGEAKVELPAPTASGEAKLPLCPVDWAVLLHLFSLFCCSLVQAERKHDYDLCRLYCESKWKKVRDVVASSYAARNPLQW